MTYSGTIYHNHKNIGNVSIFRDKFGIPHINASSYTDAMYGLGYVHSQDRLWSIHFKRRISQGRLSEFVGRDTLLLDTYMRQTEFYEQAEKQYRNMTGFQKEILDSYCLGFNDAVAQRQMLPIEFLLTGDQYEPWTPQDTFALGQLMNFFMTLDYLFEPFKNMVKEKYGKDVAEEVFAAKAKYLFDNITILNDEELKQSKIFKQYVEQDITQKNNREKSSDFILPREFKEGYFNLFQVDYMNRNFQQGKGSNNWVVTGNLTFNGKPLIANDPHLENTMPTAWYLNEILFPYKGKQRFACGATIPGLPLTMLGITNYLSWTITNNMADTSDNYIETIQDDQYLYDGKWIKMQIKESLIKVRGESEPIKIKQRRTHHGPLLDTIFDFGDPKKPIKLNKTYALAWHGHIDQVSQYLASYKMVTADSPQEFEDGMFLFQNPVLNILYATVDNHIGYYTIGRLPIKRNPDDIFMKNGSDPYNDWVRFYSKEEQPRVLDPPKGFLVTANNKVASDNLIHRHSSSQLTIARSQRATELLQQQIAQKRLFTIQDFMNYQQDVIDSYCQKAKPHIINLFKKYGHKELKNDTKSIDRIKKAMNILETWNCSMDASGQMAIGAAVYGVWEQKFVILFFNEMTDEQYYNNRVVMNLIFDQFLFRHIVLWDTEDEILSNTDAEYCKNKETRSTGTKRACIYNFLKAFDNTVDFLQSKFGEDPLYWQWGKLNTMAYKHSIFSESPLKFIFDRQNDGYGNRRTINVGGINLIRDQWKSIYSANLRVIISMDNKTKSYYVSDTGQSENIFSQHYDDQMKLFEKGKYIEMIYGESRLLESNENILYLKSAQIQEGNASIISSKSQDL